MLVFISWSKPDAKAVAVELKHCIDMCLGAAGVSAWMSEIDIQKGARWSTEVANKLENTSTGIICVTPENVREPWLYFEAGALSKSVSDAAVHPLLLGSLEANALPTPLGQFQATRFGKEAIIDLLLTIARSVDAKVRDADVRARLDRSWNAIEKAEAAVSRKEPDLEPRPVRQAAQKEIPKPNDPIQLTELEELAYRILVGAGVPLSPEECSRSIGGHVLRAETALDGLVGKGLAIEHLNYAHGTRYSLSKLGKRSAVESGLV
ncbi:toll/interleukin-1 receptor domain-containing protein [Paraburkholderia sp. Ac-20340]|uniref:toll/interleukin-1 receptor domain-containing protein n=1 Tax=Paraburkholderia sp. Ac-20340 TaxID=2703888 RepID=UPI00197D7BC3|nr:toll/interleukin-1 receptor domain-containing protein [Paraburkholderia sp. Ac-20340]MBN3855183.1 toll/interleukin-1 receptor domain-containing protein [Paraburkholderia sp. Ac-20340]